MSSIRPVPVLLALLAGMAMLLGMAPARAQTLVDALSAAYSNNPTLLTARAALRVVDENVPQALSNWRPNVQISSTAGVADTRFRGTSPQNSLEAQRAQPFLVVEERGITTRSERVLAQNSVTVTQPVFRGGRTVAQTRRAENQVLAQRARLFATEQQVLQDTVTNYVAVIRDQELLRLNINNEQVLTEQLRATNERFRVGEITRTDVAQAESRLAGATAQRAQAEGNLQISRSNFTRSVGAPPGRLTAPQPLSTPVRSAPEAAQVASMNNPNVVAALFDEGAARDNIDLQLGALLPTVTVQGQVFRNDNVSTAQSRAVGGQVVATVTVPLYQGGFEYALVRQARQSAQQARATVDDQRRFVSQQATQAWEQLQSSRAQVQAGRAQIRAAEIALDGVQREAIVGSRTTLDVLNAEQELLNARTSLVQALSTVVQQSYALAATVGRLTAQDLGLPVEFYDMRAYYNEVRNRWVGLGDYTERSQAAARAGRPGLDPRIDPVTPVVR